MGVQLIRGNDWATTYLWTEKGAYVNSLTTSAGKKKKKKKNRKKAEFPAHRFRDAVAYKH